ncbi:hypothetical protein [Thiolapillus sp.]
MALFAKPRGEPQVRQPAQPGFSELGCPAFAGLVEAMHAREEKTDPKFGILDLAKASGNHIQFFSQFRCKYHIGDVLDAMESWPVPGEDTPVVDLETLLPLHNTDGLDLILAWDGLNYLHPELLPLLSGHLAGKCNPGAWLHAFVYTRGDMPALPLRFDILSPEKMRCTRRGDDWVGAPCPPQRVLESRLPEFHVVQSRLLQNGLHEYLFQVSRH